MTSNGPCTLAVSPASVAEDGTPNLVYTFTRSGPNTSALTVNYSITGTADSSDYSGVTPGSGKTISFAAGASSVSLTIDPTADTAIEADETVALTLTAGTGYTIGTPAAVVGTIRNDDPTITLAVAPGSVTEDGSTNLVFTFSRSGPTTAALTVGYSINGTADASDYSGATPGSGKTIRFAAGASSVSLTIDPTADTAIEADETVALTLTAGTGYTIGTPAAVVGTIRNDDPTITLAVAPGSVTEDGSTNLVYTFSRTGLTTNALTVNYAVGGTATLTTDYSQSGAATFTATTGTVTFAAGSSTATVTIDPIADTTTEADETVALTLAAGTGYTIGTATAVTSTIRNDDIESSVSFVLRADHSSLKLTGTTRINGTGNSGENSIIGNANNNRIAGLGGKDLLTGGGGSADRDVFVFNQLSDSLLLEPISGTGGYFDEITDYNSKDRFVAPFSVETDLLTDPVGNAASIAPEAIAAVLTTSTFAANSAAAFTASSHAGGTFIAMNDRAD